MNRFYNKHGPLPGHGQILTRHARDGIGADSSITHARDGTFASYRAIKLRQSSGPMPRDATIIAVFKRNNRRILPEHHDLIFSQIWRKIRFRWRKKMAGNRPLRPVMGEVCPLGSYLTWN
ncbi:MAG: hypothetical protein IPH84_01580 [Bacteroidales bacterium]|nr:hypothetical protein [Bacteroidales bacterium]